MNNIMLETKKNVWICTQGFFKKNQQYYGLSICNHIESFGDEIIILKLYCGKTQYFIIML